MSITSGWFAAIECAMCCSITVLPDLGDDTSRPRWPLPIGATMSMIAAGDVLLGLDVALEDQRLVGEQRRQVLEEDLALGVLGRLAVDLVDLDQREVALAVLGRADLAFDRVAGVQVEAADLRRRDVDVVGAGEIATCRASAGSRSRRAAPRATPSPKMLSPFFAWLFSSAKMRSCLRIRLAPSISFVLAISTSSVTCLALSSDRCMGGNGVEAADDERGQRPEWPRGWRRKRIGKLGAAEGGAVTAVRPASRAAPAPERH